MQNNYLKIAEAFAKRLREATDTQVVILPSEVNAPRDYRKRTGEAPFAC